MLGLRLLALLPICGRPLIAPSLMVLASYCNCPIAVGTPVYRPDDLHNTHKYKVLVRAPCGYATGLTLNSYPEV